MMRRIICPRFNK